MKEVGTSRRRHVKERIESMERGYRTLGEGDSGGFQGPACWRRS